MPDEQLTREIFGNIDSVSKLVFYALSTISLACFSYGVVRRVRHWRSGRPSGEPIDWKGAAWRLARVVLSQQTLRRSRPIAGRMHAMMFWGFTVLFVGTVLVAIEHYAAALLGREPTDPLFHKGLYYAIFEMTLDLFGLIFLAGVIWFAIRRFRGSSSMAHHISDWFVIGALIALGTTGYVVEGARLIYEPSRLPGVSPVGWLCSEVMRAAGLGAESAAAVHWGLWWFHAVVALGLVAAIPYCRLWHALAGMIRLAAADRELGQMAPVTIEELEATGFVGVGKKEDFSRLQLIEIDACVSCGRCEDVCPAFEAGKPLSPRNVVQDLRHSIDAAKEETDLAGNVVGEETLWSCTACSACVDVCPLGVRPLTFITDLRRFLVGEGRISGAPATALSKMQRTGNPWGLPQQDRMQWAEGLEVPTVDENPDFDWLFWVGCAATFDRRTQKVARAIVQLLNKADISFAVLGTKERCTGESARRMGDEFVFQELAATNIENLQQHRVRRVVTHCPHCLNSLRRDYPQFGGEWEIVHHSELLAELIAEGRLQVPGEFSGKVTFHDPCYLARVQEISDAPRDVLKQAMAASDSESLQELPRNREQTACCGAGGGRMWFDDAPEDRIGKGRIDEIVATGAETVAVGCPFCLTMLSDGLAARGAEVKVLDIAEILADGLSTPATASEKGTPA